jgi:hypothetical protein
LETQIKIIGNSSTSDKDRRANFFNLYKNSPLPENEILTNLGLYLNRQTLSRILFMQELYSKVLDVHGVILEFGVRWGQNLSLFSSFRGMYEPYNYNRKIVGFDTFSGFPEVAQQDGSKVNVGDYAVTKNYESYLNEILKYHQEESPIPHLKKYELVKGDATKTFPKYIEDNPHTIIALAYFDFDIYLPTKVCLEHVMKRVTKGSIIAFDELNCPEFPGETLAVLETIGLSKYAIKRSALNPLVSYLVIE